MEMNFRGKDLISWVREWLERPHVSTTMVEILSLYAATPFEYRISCSLLKSEIKLTDDNRIEILDNNSNIRYNPKGELLTIEQRVKEFLDANPHFSQGSKSGTGSQSSVGGQTVKPFNIQDLDMSKPEDRAKYAEYRKERDSKPTQINLNNK